MLGGKASVAMLHRAKPETSALTHDYVTETCYILSELDGPISCLGYRFEPTKK